MRRTTLLALAFAAAACLLPVGQVDAHGPLTIHVRTDAQFAAAVQRLRFSGGTIKLAPTWFRGLEIGPRGWHQLRIVGTRRTHVEQILLRGTRRVSIGPLTISPISQDARIQSLQSSRIDIHDVKFTAAGTRYASTLQLPISNRITVRRSEFTHCGDRVVAHGQLHPPLAGHAT